MIRVVVVDDQPLMREGIASYLRAAGLTVVATGDDAAALALPGAPPNVVVLSTHDLSHVDPQATLRRWPRAAIVAYTSSADREARADAVDRGVCAFAAREGAASELAAAIHAARAGDAPLALAESDHRPGGANGGLTRRECDVLRVVASGLSNQDIAAELRISEHTVKSHLHHAMQKLGADTRAAAVHQALQRALI